MMRTPATQVIARDLDSDSKSHHVLTPSHLRLP